MNIFIGDYKTFYKFFGGYARNNTLALTKKYKSGICACCGTNKKEIQSAHKHGFERSSLVEKFFYESIIKEEHGVYHINLDKFEELFENFHTDVSNFHFLCEDCHSKYDKSEIDENDFKYKSESIKNSSKQNIRNTKNIYSENKRNPKDWSRKTAKDYCDKNGYKISPCYTFANENTTKKGIYWANPNPDYLKQDWDIILNDANSQCFWILHIPADSYKVDDFYLKKNKTGQVYLQLEIDTGSYIETKKEIHLKKYLVKQISYKKD